MLLPFAEAERLTKTHHCARCGHRALLVARAVPGRPELDVVCGGCNSDEHLTRSKSLTQIWRENPDAVPVHTANKLEAKYGGKPVESTALAKMDEKALVQRMEGAKWLNQMQPQDKRALAQLSLQYGLDPLMGELTIYEGKPYISVNGMVRVAHENPLFEGLEDRPMTQEEKQAYGITQKIGWIAKVYRKGWRVPVVGTGAADPDRPFRNNPVERDRPQWMARSRAIRQALRLAFPAAVPFKMAAAEERGVIVDTTTGEIIDASPVRPNLTVVEGEAVTPDDEPDLPFDDSEFPEPTAGEEEAEQERGDLFTESRRADLLAGIHQAVDGKRDGWKRFCNWWGTQYDGTPEQGTVEQLERALAFVEGR